MSSCYQKSIVPSILTQISNTRYHLLDKAVILQPLLTPEPNKKKSGERCFLSIVPLKLRNWCARRDFDAVLCIYEEFPKACVPEHSRTQESSLRSCPLWLFLGPCCQCLLVCKALSLLAFQSTALLPSLSDHFH